MKEGMTTIHHDTLLAVIREITKPYQKVKDEIDRLEAYRDTTPSLVDTAIESIKKIAFDKDVVLAVVRDYAFSGDDRQENQDTAISRYITVDELTFEVWYYYEGGIVIYDENGDALSAFTKVDEDGYYVTDFNQLHSLVREAWGLKGDGNATT